MMDRNGVRKVLWSAAIAVVSIGAGNVHASVLYSVTDLGIQGSSGTIATAAAINGSGTVVGISAVSSTLNQAYYYSGGVQTGVGSVAPGTNSSATAISSAGEIVGMSTVVSTSINEQGFVDVGGVLTPVGAFYTPSNGPAGSTANGVTAGGLVVGGAQNKIGITSAFTEPYLYNGTLHDLGQLPGTIANKGGRVNGINDSGLAVGMGSGFSAGANTHAFELNTGDGTTYNGNTLATAGVDLTTPFNNAAVAAGYPAFTANVSSSANAVNANGDIAGAWNIGGLSSLFQSIFYSAASGMATDLGVLPGGGTWSTAFALNDYDAVVGSATTSSSNSTTHAFIWTQAMGMVDLNTLIDPTSNPGGWVLTSASGINDSGQIVGTATDSAGATRAFMLSPIPEPTTFSLIGLAAAGLMTRRRRN